MIDLFSRDDYAALGVATALECERIAYRRVGALAAGSAPVLAVGADFSPAECAALAARRALVLHGGPVVGRHLLGTRADAAEGAAVLPLSEAAWPQGLFATAQPFGVTALRLARVPWLRLAAPARGTALGTLLSGASEAPAAAQVGAVTWCALDLGTAIADCLGERDTAPPRPRAPRLDGLLHRAAETLYYAAPPAVRAAVQRRAYDRLAARLAALGERASTYPIDPTGWLLFELLGALLRRAAGTTVRVARWPQGRRAAAVLTHDLEPRAYAYGEGFDRLLAAEAGAAPAGAVGVVTRAGARHLGGGRAARLAGRGVYCHGTDHRGEVVWGRRRLARTLRAAADALADQLGRPVRGYRSPRLDRSSDLDWALDAAGFVFDSSHPDVDRENLRHYGGGVRLALPYRPLLEDAPGHFRRSRCLEVPLTAPDCIQPLLAGDSPQALRAAVAEKAAWVRASGGCYVALVHTGVFGADDAARRGAHLAFVRAQPAHPDTWFTDFDTLVDWWTARERVRADADDGVARVVNDGERPLAGAVLLVDDASGTRAVPLAPLAPGAAVTVALAAAPVEEVACAR